MHPRVGLDEGVGPHASPQDPGAPCGRPGVLRSLVDGPISG